MIYGLFKHSHVRDLLTKWMWFVMLIIIVSISFSFGQSIESQKCNNMNQASWHQVVTIS